VSGGARHALRRRGLLAVSVHSVVAVGLAVLTGRTLGDPDVNASALPREDASRAAASVATLAPTLESPAAPTVPTTTKRGEVRVAGGPFADRLSFHDLRLRAGRVSGTVDVVSDVSEVIGLEVRVDFYDQAGTLVGSDRQVFDTEATDQYHTDAGVAGLPVTLAAPLGGSRSAVLTVPVLVNE
jgi:hypothetical protein